MAILLAVLLSLSVAHSTLADDSAASLGVGGIHLEKNSRISMVKESLNVGIDRVTVEYEFLNNTSQDINTKVAFPIPEYRCDEPIDGCPENAFHDLQVWADGKAVAYSADLKAILKDRDYSAELQRLGIDPDAFGHFDSDALAQGFTNGGDHSDFAKLSAEDRAKLVRLGLADDDMSPLWSLRKLFYWEQTFPAKTTVHIRHQYKPWAGWTDVDYRTMSALAKSPQATQGGQAWGYLPEIAGACVDRPLQAKLQSDVRNASVVFTWVDFILKTANNWKTPLSNFELVVEKPKPADSRSVWYASFCWDGRVERLDPDHFRVRAKNFVPERDLHVGFFEVRSDAPASR